MLEARCRHGKFKGPAVIAGPGCQSVDQTSHERITASDPVDYMGDLVYRRLKQICTVEKHTRPGIVISIYRSAKGYYYLFRIRELLNQLPAY